MRTFYIFKIKEEVQKLYFESPENLYHILKYLYYLRKKENAYGVGFFHQLVDIIDKHSLNRNIFIKYQKERVYSKLRGIHVINDLYKDEISSLDIKYSYILIECNQNTSSFFSILSEASNDFFICDFVNEDYFWLSDTKVLV